MHHFLGRQHLAAAEGVLEFAVVDAQVAAGIETKEGIIVAAIIVVFMKALHPGTDQPDKEGEAQVQRKAEQQKLEDSKSDVGWGHQIRSYVLDQSRIKDLRTNYESSNTQKILDGDLDPFIQASLKQGI